jgi:hypothetical protein
MANVATTTPLFRLAIPTRYAQRFEGNLNGDHADNGRNPLK